MLTVDVSPKLKGLEFGSENVKDGLLSVEKAELDVAARVGFTLAEEEVDVAGSALAPVAVSLRLVWDTSPPKVVFEADLSVCAPKIVPASLPSALPAALDFPPKIGSFSPEPICELTGFGKPNVNVSFFS